MKTRIYLTALLMPFVFGSCDDILGDAGDFSVSTEKTVYNAGDEVTFNFTGNPDYIMFYSGEPDHEYKFRQRTEIAMEDIDKVEFAISINTQYGTNYPQQPEYPLRMYFASEFEGFTRDDFDTDKARVTAFQSSAKDVTKEVEVPTAPNITKHLKIDISEYADNFILGLYYEGYTGTTQRRFNFSNISIKSFLKNGKEMTVAGAKDMGFAALDIGQLAPQANGNPYFMGSGDGTWNLNNIGSTTNSMIFTGGGMNALPNNDWLISSPFKLNSCVPDTGVSVKSIGNLIPSYTHVFKEPGTYTVTFIAGNSNYKGSNSVVKELTIEVE